MADIRIPLMTNEGIAPWATEVQQSVREKSIIRSGDLQVGAGPYGNYVGMRNEFKYSRPPMNYRGQWNITSSYNIMDVVRVLPNTTYDLPWVGTPTKTVRDGIPWVQGTVTIGTATMTWAQPYFVAVPGTYVCVTPIPSFANIMLMQDVTGINVYFDSSATGKLSDKSNFVQKNINYMRFYDVNYYPVWPEKPTQASYDPNDLTKFQGHYWELMSMLPTEERVCKNDVVTTIYVDAQSAPSGSANYTGSASP